LIRIIWEFTVCEGMTAEFEQHYSATGSWAALFRGHPGFLGTTLLRDPKFSRRYVTIDAWADSASLGAMRENAHQKYEALDRTGEALTEHEREIGVFEEVGE
jgi:heme-degrading monooxygenase HmoA